MARVDVVAAPTGRRLGLQHAVNNQVADVGHSRGSRRASITVTNTASVNMARRYRF